MMRPRTLMGWASGKRILGALLLVAAVGALMAVRAQARISIAARTRVPIAHEGRIGPIISVVALHDGDIAVLGDVQRVLAVVRSVDGAVLVRKNLTGDGWALGQPVTMAGFGRGAIALIDRSPPRVLRAVLSQAGADLSSTSATQLLAATSACAMGQTLFVAALTDPVSRSMLLHELSPTGRIVRSIVPQEPDSRGFMRALYEVLSISCDAVNNRVYTASIFQGRVSALDPRKGAPLWTRNLTEFKKIRLENPDSATLVPGVPAGGIWHEIASIFPVGNRHLVVQVARGAVGRFGAAIVRTLVFDSATGAVLAEMQGMQRIVGVSDRSLYAVSGIARDTLWRVELSLPR